MQQLEHQILPTEPVEAFIVNEKGDEIVIDIPVDEEGIMMPTTDEEFERMVELMEDQGADLDK